MSHDILRRVMLKRAVMAPMKIDQERQNLTKRQGRLARPVALARAPQTTVIDRRKGLAAIVNIAEDSIQFVQGSSWVMRGGFVTESAQHTGASCFFSSQCLSRTHVNYCMHTAKAVEQWLATPPG